MPEQRMEIWDLWYPKAAAAGIAFARSRIDPQEIVLVHAAPDWLTVHVYHANGSLKAQGIDLSATGDSPMARLRCTGSRVEREEVWPSEEDLGRVVILPGGEAGILTEWWHAPDHSEWRWRVEFYNKKSS